jgi:hypothetical protein
MPAVRQYLSTFHVPVKPNGTRYSTGSVARGAMSTDDPMADGGYMTLRSCVDTAERAAEPSRTDDASLDGAREWPVPRPPRDTDRVASGDSTADAESGGSGGCDGGSGGGGEKAAAAVRCTAPGGLTPASDGSGGRGRVTAPPVAGDVTPGADMTLPDVSVDGERTSLGGDTSVTASASPVCGTAAGRVPAAAAAGPRGVLTAAAVAPLLSLVVSRAAGSREGVVSAAGDDTTLDASAIMRPARDVDTVGAATAAGAGEPTGAGAGAGAASARGAAATPPLCSDDWLGDTADAPAVAAPPVCTAGDDGKAAAAEASPADALAEGPVPLTVPRAA